MSSARVDIVIPVLNEAHVLARSVSTVRAYLQANLDYDWRIVIVDNGSIDGTGVVARELCDAHSDVRCMSLRQKGRGRALRQCWMQSDADAVCYMDVDLSTELRYLNLLIDSILKHGYDVATGSRLLPDSRTRRSFFRETVSRIYNLLVRTALGTQFSDAQCGFKAMSRAAVQAIVPQVRDESWFFDTEMLTLAEKQGLRIADIPVEWNEDDDSRVKILRTAWDDIKGIWRVRKVLRQVRPEVSALSAGEASVKVLLVNPFQVDLVQKKGRIYNRTWTPLDLAYCGAILEQDGIEVAILDANAEQLGPQEVAARAKGYDKVFITSTSLDRWQCPHLDIHPFLKTVHALNAVVPEVYVMGSHGTVKPEEMLEETRARAVLRGEPETTVRELCAGLPFSEVRGITWRDGGKVVHNQDQKPVQMEQLPMPAFHLLPMHQYHYEMLGGNFTLFEMSRGCASKCTFCLLKTYGVGVRKKSVERLVAEVEYGVKNFGIKTAYFMDLEFTVLRKQVVEFCKILIEKKLDFTWCCQTRLDLVDEELLALMKKAGCRLIHTGVEAGSEEVLRIVDKGITMPQIEKGMRLIHQAGIETACFFIMGFPESGKDEMGNIVSLAKRLSPTYALFHIAAPYPGTRLYEQVKNDPNIRFSDGSLFPEAIEGRFTLPELKAMTRKAYLSYYLRPSYVWARLMKGEIRPLASQFWLFLQFVRT